MLAEVLCVPQCKNSSSWQGTLLVTLHGIGFNSITHLVCCDHLLLVNSQHVIHVIHGSGLLQDLALLIILLLVDNLHKAYCMTLLGWSLPRASAVPSKASPSHVKRYWHFSCLQKQQVLHAVQRHKFVKASLFEATKSKRISIAKAKVKH